MGMDTFNSEPSPECPSHVMVYVGNGVVLERTKLATGLDARYTN
jgi:hypothetical protein